MIAVICVSGLAGCAGEAEDYPHLLPTAQMLAEPALPAHAGTGGAEAEAQLSARAAALRSRAVGLRGPVIEADSPARRQIMRPE